MRRLNHRGAGATRLPTQSGHALPDAARNGDEGLSALAEAIRPIDPSAVPYDGPWRHGLQDSKGKVARACCGDVWGG